VDKPNIILLTIDTLRPDRLGSFGCTPSITPNIDHFAESGIRFTQAITGGSWTQAAFPVIMTSTYASMYGGCLGPLSRERPSPISAFRNEGYRTVAFSTSPLLSKSYGYDLGFDEFNELNPGEKDPGMRKIKGGQLVLQQSITHYFSRILGIQTRPAKIYSSAEALTEEVCSWIAENERPFFLWAHYMDVHWPYHLESALTEADQIAQAWKDVDHLHKANWNGEVITVEQREHYIDLYEKALGYTDAQFGRLMKFIDKAGISEDTIIVLVSDHGEEFLEHGRWGHWEDNLHDEILTVPLIMRVPELKQEVVINQQIRLLDIMPTLLELGQVPAPEDLLGSSFSPVWGENPELYSPQFAICEMWRDEWHIIAVREENRKLIWDSKKPGEAELFDLAVDPREQENIYLDQSAASEDLIEQVNIVREKMRATKPEQDVSEPDLDDEMVARLRDLGYME
jgi:arylsulfatase A-like enzyme